MSAIITSWSAQTTAAPEHRALGISITRFAPARQAYRVSDRDNANLAAKMSRAYNHSYETLNRIRGKVPPPVKFRPVNVAGGAQAVVGVINHSNQDPSKYAAGIEPSSIEHEPGAPMRRQNPQRQAVSGAGGEGEIEMPHARRRCG